MGCKWIALTETWSFGENPPKIAILYGVSEEMDLVEPPITKDMFSFSCLNLIFILIIHCCLYKVELCWVSIRDFSSVVNFGTDRLCFTSVVLCLVLYTYMLIVVFYLPFSVFQRDGIWESWSIVFFSIGLSRFSPKLLRMICGAIYRPKTLIIYISQFFGPINPISGIALV